MFSLKKIKKVCFGDGENESNLNHFMRKKQTLVGIFVLAILIVATLLLHMLAEKNPKHSLMAHKKQATSVDGVLSTDFTQKNEMSALEQQQEQMDSLRKQLETLNKQSQSAQLDKANNKGALIKEINKILSQRESLKAHKTVVKYSNPNVSQEKSAPFSSSGQGSFSSNPSGIPLHPLETIRFNYKKPPHPSAFKYADRQKNDYRSKTPRNYVPAGTFAKVVLLEGADANASVNAQSDTTPILVRILNSGTLPNGHHSHLKGCFVLASMYGDISSERGEARLTKISCTRTNGTILEKKVQGYLSFAGKEGIKGQPVMRNGKILAMAGLSGMLSGFGSALQQTTQTHSISPLGATSTVNPNNIWQNGLYGGTSTAMNRLANYYIKRADQYHPIIEIGSGTVATIIFQNGFSLTDDNTVRGQNDPTGVSTDRNNMQEIKTLLRQAQTHTPEKNNAPFTSVN